MFVGLNSVPFVHSAVLTGIKPSYASRGSSGQKSKRFAANTLNSAIGFCPISTRQLAKPAQAEFLLCVRSCWTIRKILGYTTSLMSIYLVAIFWSHQYSTKEQPSAQSIYRRADGSISGPTRVVSVHTS